jgi:hypothetical protein
MGPTNGQVAEYLAEKEGWSDNADISQAFHRWLDRINGFALQSSEDSSRPSHVIVTATPEEADKIEVARARVTEFAIELMTSPSPDKRALSKYLAWLY